MKSYENDSKNKFIKNEMPDTFKMLIVEYRHEVILKYYHIYVNDQI